MSTTTTKQTYRYKGDHGLQIAIRAANSTEVARYLRLKQDTPGYKSLKPAGQGNLTVMEQRAWIQVEA